ncbi:S-type anion channel SLAH1-like [Macadamia integrifolia]|uniref:S-type anion channel SLAH1-like n=1 Tax=Macadamia integrifolia TaxID=60698 RepID=UPI001C4FC77C|nr:S-type anion channel SLAH1-like [Macadamia integrifolia]
MEDDNNNNNNKSQLMLDASAVSSIDVAGKKRLIPSPSLSSILTKIHAGYFRISLSLCGQALLWKTLGEPTSHPNALQRLIHMVPSASTIFLWSLALLVLLILSLLYLLRCFFYFKMVKAEFLHHIGVNYLFAPWISWLLLLQSCPFIGPRTVWYLLLWWVFVFPVIVLDVKIYGQWFTKGKRFLSRVANPTSLLSVMGNLAGAQAAAHMGWRESAVCMFTLGMAHYLVLFVTLYQRLSETDSLPVMLRPVFFLFFAAPSMASLAWDSISGNFDTCSKMLFFLSLFLFTSLVSRPALFKKAMKRFNVAWWAYSFPLTMLALAATQYAQEVKGGTAQGIMYGLSGLSVLVSLALIVSTALNTSLLLRDRDPILNPPTS